MEKIDKSEEEKYRLTLAALEQVERGEVVDQSVVSEWAKKNLTETLMEAARDLKLDKETMMRLESLALGVDELSPQDIEAIAASEMDIKYDSLNYLLDEPFEDK